MLINLAQKASYEYPDLAGIALEIAQDLLPEIDNPSLRSMMLQNLVRAYRNLDGEVSEEMIRDGYILADDMRQQEELSRQSAQPILGQMVAIMSFGSMSSVSNADRLEIFLVSELARDSFDQAIRFARTIEDDALRLEYLVQIAQKLGSSY
jgi:hypothetical protein